MCNARHSRGRYFSEGTLSASQSLPTGGTPTTTYSCASPDCSGHGTCAVPSYVCLCVAGYKGTACQSETVPGVLSLSPASTLLVPMSASGEVRSASVAASNGGDYAIEFYVSTTALEASGLCVPSPAWCFDPQSPRSRGTVARLGPGEDLDLAFTLTTLPSQAQGDTVATTVTFYWRDPSSAVWTVRQLAVSVEYGTAYFLTGLSAACGGAPLAVSPSFTPFWFAYATAASVPYACRGGVTVQLAGDSLLSDVVGAVLGTVAVAPVATAAGSFTYGLPSLAPGATTRLRVTLLAGVAYDLDVAVAAPSSVVALSKLVVAYSAADLGLGQTEAPLDPAFGTATATAGGAGASLSFEYSATVPAADIVYVGAQTTSVGVGLEDISLSASWTNTFTAFTALGARIFQLEPPSGADEMTQTPPNSSARSRMDAMPTPAR